METVRIEDFLEGQPILRESQFRVALEKFDWGQYRGEDVLIKGCASLPVPTWAYLLIAVRLQPVAGAIYFGEGGNPIPIWDSAPPRS